MSDYINKEFSRILSNPGNEIISESLKEKLKPIQNSFNFSIKFEDSFFDCDLDSFTKSNMGQCISVSVSLDVVSRILKNEDFSLENEELDFSINSSDVFKISCFKFRNDNYILELDVNGDLPDD